MLTRSLMLLAFSVFLIGPAAAQAPAWQWGLQTTNPAPADGSTAMGYAVATDAAGRVYVGGAINESATSGPVSRSFGSAGTVGPGRNGFIAQVTAAGQWAWTTAAVPSGTSSTPPHISVNSVAVTAGGDVYATGIVAGSGVQVGSQNQALGGTGQGVFVARLSSMGVCQWVQVVEMTAFLPPVLAIDPGTGGVVLVGAYQGSPSFGGTALPASNFYRSGSVYVARLSAAGQWLSATASAGTVGVISLNAAVGPAGQVAIVGSHGAGTIAFGSNTLTAPTGADESFIVAQLSPANQWQWAVGGRNAGYNNSVTLSAAYTATGALWVCGRGVDGSVVGPITLSAPITSGSTSYTGFLGQLSATGQWGTVQQLPPSSAGLSVLGWLAADAAGNAVTMGGLRGYAGAVQTTIGSHTLTAPSAGLVLYIASLSSAGQWRYVATVPQPALADGLNPTGMTLDGSGSLYFTGGLKGGLTLGSTTLMGSASSTNWGDVVLGKLTNATALGTRSSAAAALALLPNPAHSRATLQLPAASQAPSVTLTDALGRTARTYLLPAHSSTATLDLTGLAPGLYVVRCDAALGRLVVE
ncbi:T9SS type A sorting domain-containing protein [Microvirga sp. STS02]|uniref:T9SS type A sorting domain-containing protein n=1 Tax=Hymenobacter negativus TaxID=2795026 RepID=UPI0018DDE756|nr:MULTISPECIES: T9SS type A sorting domain-containing protein [Bacteria]MBH8570901.1 T9SS type A sorting domain-containing protein [Hymenobacter negativus]MBR7210639.1 T9SS type A sorting domain-containing protein [Microvirga sp. STS02]